MENFPQHLLEFMKSHFHNCGTNKAGTEIIMPCKFCEERTGRPDTGRHLYISLKPPFQYHCFKDNSHSGILTPKILEKLLNLEGQSLDSSIAEELETESRIHRNSSNYRVNRAVKYGLNVPVPNMDPFSTAKLAYINNRLGLELNSQDIANDKIILSLYEFLSYNKIKFQRNNYMDLINTYFIGFLSNTNMALNLRRVANDSVKLPPSLSERYTNFKIFQTDQKITNYYILPSRVDVFKPIRINIAEGPFDILSVRHNLRQNPDNEIFAAIQGNRYLGLIKYFIEVMGLILIEIHIYPDNDIQDYVLPEIKRVVTPLCDVYIHKNITPGEKDFGVPMSKIDEVVRKL